MQAFLSPYQAENATKQTHLLKCTYFPGEIGMGNFRFSYDTLFICVVPDMTSTFSPFSLSLIHMQR